MAGKKQLPPVRAVKPGEQPPPSSYSDAAARGTRLDELRAMRRILAAHIDSPTTHARDLASLMRQAREISKEIDDLEVAEVDVEVSDDDARSTGDAEFKLEAI